MNRQLSVEFWRRGRSPLLSPASSAALTTTTYFGTNCAFQRHDDDENDAHVVHSRAHAKRVMNRWTNVQDSGVRRRRPLLSGENWNSLGSAARLYRCAGASGMMTGVLTEIDPNYYSPLALLMRVNNNVEREYDTRLKINVRRPVVFTLRRRPRLASHSERPVFSYLFLFR